MGRGETNHVLEFEVEVLEVAELPPRGPVLSRGWSVTVVTCHFNAVEHVSTPSLQPGLWKKFHSWKVNMCMRACVCVLVYVKMAKEKERERERESKGKCVGLP